MLLLPLGKRNQEREEAREERGGKGVAFNFICCIQSKEGEEEGRGTSRRRILSISFHHYALERMKRGDADKRHSVHENIHHLSNKIQLPTYRLNLQLLTATLDGFITTHYHT